jgi:hypothetical protein
MISMLEQGDAELVPDGVCPPLARCVVKNIG